MTAGEVERDSLMTEIDTLTTEQIAPLLEELAVMETEIAAWRGDRVAELQIGNAAITPDSAYQEYEQVAYAIFLSTIAQGEAALSIGQQDTLENIAVLCPLIAGSGVFWARYILQYYIPGLAWELDECEGLEERSGGTVKKEAETTTTARIFPNPTRGSLTLQLSSPLSQEGMLSIYNVDGKTVFSERLGAGTLERQLDVSGLPAGIYLCEVKEDAQLIFAARIVVTE